MFSRSPVNHPFALALVASLLLGLPSASPQAADEPELIPRELLFGNPERFRGRISPAGDKVSFVAPVDGVQNVFVGPADDLDAAVPVTNDRSRGIQVYHWSASNDHLLYLRDTGGDENDHVHVVDLTSGEARDLTPFAGARSELWQKSWSNPDEIVVGINARNPQRFDAYRINIRTGQMRFLFQNEKYESFVFDDALEPRVGVLRTPDGGSEIHRADRDDTGALTWTKIGLIPPEDTRNTSLQGMAPDGQHIYLLDSRGRDKAALVTMSLADGSVKVLAEDPKADVAGVLFEPATREVMAYSVNYQRTRWYGLDEDGQRHADNVAREVPGDARILGLSRDGNQWIIAANAPQDPIPYYLYDRRDGKARRLFSSYPALSQMPLQPVHPVTIESRDGLEMVSYLTLPAGADANGDGRADALAPMVLLVHGGPWARDTYGYGAFSQWLANRGYAVLQVNYRGSTGFGKAFLNASAREWAGKMHDDLIDAVEWAVEQGITRPDQVAIMGGSYGGYATLVGLTFTPERFACGVDIVGPSNLVTLLSSIPPYWTSLLDEFSRLVGDPRTEAGRALLTERSPLSRADAIEKPLLIGQGANDPRVKQAESDQIVAAMTEKDLPVTYVLYPDEGHGFARPENNLAFFGIAEGFLHACLGGRYEPLGDHLAGSSTQVPTGAEHVPGLAAALEGFEPEVRK
jgi:dipeptidyl aminopeptidase/acylaminoacyl peptidase